MGQLRDMVEAEDAQYRYDPLDLTRDEQGIYTLKAEASGVARAGWHALMHNLLMKPFRRLKKQEFLLLELADAKFWRDGDRLHVSANIRFVLLADLEASRDE